MDRTSSVRFQSPLRSGGNWFRVYDAILPLLLPLLWLVSIFHSKLREALKGRRGGTTSWHIDPLDDRKIILIHVASRGEFEGALPLIQKIGETNRYRVAVSFSSPSARRLAEKIPELWAYGYLPLDFLQHQLRFLNTIDPQIILILKHDLWPNMIRAAHSLNIPVIVANANFHSRSLRSMPVVSSFHRAFMKNVSAIWTVSDADTKRAEKLQSPRTDLRTVGDTRYDRVLSLVEQGRRRFGDLKAALNSDSIFILGSSWPNGEQLGWEAFNTVRNDFPETKLIVAPHEPTKEAIQRNCDNAKRLGMSIKLFSEWTGDPIKEAALLIDRVGILSQLYAVGWAAYIGGGFGKGVHSVLEPVAFGIPVVFGPNHHVSHEASLLIESGGGSVVKTTEDLANLWQSWLSTPDLYNKTAQSAFSVVSSQTGATDRILDLLRPYIGDNESNLAS